MFGKKFGKKKMCLVKNSCQNRRASTGSRLPFPVITVYHGIITWIKLYSQFRHFPVIIPGIISGKLRYG